MGWRSTASLHATSTHQELCDGDTSTRRTMRCEQHCSEMVTKALPYWRQPNVKHAEAVASFLSLPSHGERLSWMTNDENAPKCGPPKRAGGVAARADVPRRVGLRHDGDWPLSHPSSVPYLQTAGIPIKGFLAPLWPNLLDVVGIWWGASHSYIHTFTIDQHHSRSFTTPTWVQHRSIWHNCLL